MGANDRQIAGSHYSNEYQHWDFVVEAGLGYLTGNATKYVARWRKKNVAEDLHKAIHYLDKAMEVGEQAPKIARSLDPMLRFGVQLESDDRYVVTAIVLGEYLIAKTRIMMITASSQIPTTPILTAQISRDQILSAP